MPPPCSSAIRLLVASGIGGRLVLFSCALARAILALTRSPMSALSNWARLAIMPNTSSPCGVAEARSDAPHPTPRERSVPLERAVAADLGGAWARGTGATFQPAEGIPREECHRQ